MLCQWSDGQCRDIFQVWESAINQLKDFDFIFVSKWSVNSFSILIICCNLKHLSKHQNNISCWLCKDSCREAGAFSPGLPGPSGWVQPAARKGKWPLHITEVEEREKRIKYDKIWVFPKNRGLPPQIIHFNQVFPYKPSILGYHYFWKHP